VTRDGPAPFARRVAAWTLDAVPAATVALAATWNALDRIGPRLAPAHDGLVGSMLRVLDGTHAPSANPFLVFAHAMDPAGPVAWANRLALALLEALAPTLLVFSAAIVALHVAGECSRWRGSPGKRLLGLRVARHDAPRLPPSPARSLARNLAGSLSWLTLNLGHAWALLPPAHRTLHDRLAGTQVVGTARPLPAWAVAWLWVAGLATLALPAWLFQGMYDAMVAGLLSRQP
jgi:uncharacterized RDD family membrane protein YckC